MERRGGWSPLPPTNSMAYGVVESLDSTQSSLSSLLPPRPSGPDTCSFDTSLSFAHVTFQPSYDLKTHHALSQSSLLNNSVHLLDQPGHELEQDAIDLIQTGSSPYDLTTFANLRREPKRSPHTPWNHVDASMNPGPDQSLSNLAQSKNVPHTDSGYGDSLHSRPILANSLSPYVSLGVRQSLLCDEPLGSAAQQKSLLPDQHRKQALSSSIASVSPKPPSVLGIETTGATSGSSSFRCEECSEAFNTKSEMSKHIARHSKKFTCGHTGCARGTDGFATKNDLDRHKASVHRDNTVTRKEYKCCVPGCKDPNKIWDRKDNFKAHVKRMHPDVDIEDTVAQSFQEDKAPPPDRALSHTGGFIPGYSQSTMLRQPSNLPASQPLADGSDYQTTPYYMNLGTLAEGEDMYGPSPVAGTRVAQYSNQLDIAGLPNTDYMQFPNLPPSVTAGPSHYASSSTMAQQTNVQDNQRPVFAHRNQFLAPIGHGESSQSHIRPMGIRTAPVVDHNPDDFQSQFYDLSQQGDNSPVADGGMSTIDPQLQTLQSGSWDPQSQSGGYAVPSDVSDQQLQSGLSLGNDEQPGASPAADQRLHKTWQQVQDILKTISAEEIKVMVNKFGSHPPVRGKSSCAVQRAISVIASGPNGDDRPWRCSRPGCGKTFSQKNIKTKHEERHARLFFCTFDGCYSTFGSKDDLRRHEERKHDRDAFEGYRCFAGDVTSSLHKPNCFKFFDDIELFKQHRREDHRERAGVNNGGLKALKACRMKQGIPGPFWCGFCGRVIMNDVNPIDGTLRDKFRYDHIDQHIKRDRLTMDSWVDIKSEGLTKTAVKSSNFHHPSHEDSADEEEMDVQTTELSHTLGHTETHVPPSFRRHLEAPTIDPRDRKRAHSDAEATEPIDAPYKKPRLANYQIPRQGPSMSRALSGASASAARPMLLAPNTHRQSAGHLLVVRCCLCGTSCLFGGNARCGVPDCSHEFCPNCTFFSNTSQQIIPNSSTSPGRRLL